RARPPRLDALACPHRPDGDPGTPDVRRLLEDDCRGPAPAPAPDRRAADAPDGVVPRPWRRAHPRDAVPVSAVRARSGGAGRLTRRMTIGGLRATPYPRSVPSPSSSPRASARPTAAPPPAEDRVAPAWPSAPWPQVDPVFVDREALVE